MYIDISYTGTISSEDDKGEIKVIKRNARFKATIELEAILSIETYYNQKGKINHNKSRIFHDGLGWMVVDYPRAKLAELQHNRKFEVKGFQIKKKTKR